MQSIKASEVMSRKLVTATEDEKLSRIAEKMLESRVSSVVVLSGKKVVGIVTEKDFVKFFALGVEPEAPVKQFMTRNVIVIREDRSINDARNIMLSNQIRHLPVVNADGELVGMITTRDIIESVVTLI
ncbi:MAG: CBS domain-containing protein [Candidatus Caldarchaeum sp.]|nr:CBS domain-containing protein [Candidatus Caldarchaeum sp.]